MLKEVIMYILGALTIACSFGVISARKPLSSALWLIATLALIASHYALIGAHFIAAAQVLVYAGAIMVLVLFAVLLLGTTADEKMFFFGKIGNTVLIVLGFVFGTAMLAVFLNGRAAPFNRFGARDNFGTVEAIGISLYTDFAFPLEFLTLLLLVAIVGAVLIAYEPKRFLASGRGLKAMQTRNEETPMLASEDGEVTSLEA